MDDTKRDIPASLSKVWPRPEILANPVRILVPISFTEASRKALCEASAFATVQTEVILLHVIEPTSLGLTRDCHRPFADTSIVEDCTLHLGEVRDTCLQPSLSSRVLVRQGPAVAEILRVVREVHPDLVVMAIEVDAPRDCTSQSVARQAPCPVLLVKA